MPNQPSTPGSPTITVMLLCWNHAHYLTKCLETLATQTDRDFEILFLDNVSTDQSFETAAQTFERLGLKARMLRNERPLGISANLNRLFAHSTGDLVCPLSTDDWYKPRYIEAVRDAATQFPDAAWYYGPRTSGSDNGDEVLEAEQHNASGNVFPHFLRGEHPVNMNGSAYRRTAIKLIDGWDEALRVEDFDLTFRLAQVGPCHYIDEPLAVYRSHPGSISKDIGFMVAGGREFIAKHGHHFPRGGRTVLSESIRQMAAREIDLGRQRTALPLLAQALRADPVNFRTFRTMLYLLRRTASGLFSSAGKIDC